MRLRKPIVERAMYTVFTEFFASKARRFETDKPSPAGCLQMLKETIVVLRAYEESLNELLAIQRSYARHSALPTGFPIRVTREDPTL